MSLERRYKERVREVGVKREARKYKRKEEQGGQQDVFFKCGVLAILQSRHERIRHCRWKEDDILFYTKQTRGLILYNDNK